MKKIVEFIRGVAIFLIFLGLWMIQKTCKVFAEEPKEVILLEVEEDEPAEIPQVKVEPVYIMALPISNGGSWSFVYLNL
tara:strand:- start:351 stop:587 length:237 start_codon:yes stop_codon:yes gene_type:complete